MMPEENTHYEYRFTLDSGETKTIDVCLNTETLAIICPPADAPLPDWTRLEYSQCPNCNLSAKTHTHCPIAVNISTVADAFSELSSFQQAKVSVQGNSRLFIKTTDIQTALSSILGIYMVTSGCPIMDKLRPMVRFHLPFATSLETQYRAISMYLAAQYLRYKKGKKPDWALTGFVKMYEEVHKVNVAFTNRLNAVDKCDANNSALIVLDSCAELINFNFEMDEEVPKELEGIFKPFTNSAL